MTRFSVPGRTAMILLLAAACASNEADTTGSDSAVRPDTSAIQGAGSVPSPAPSSVDSLRDTASRQKAP